MDSNGMENHSAAVKPGPSPRSIDIDRAGQAIPRVGAAPGLGRHDSGERGYPALG